MDTNNFNRENSHAFFQPLSQWLLANAGISELKWQMTLPERCAMVQVLAAIRPRVSIEVGTSHGGSLAVIHHHTTEHVYSLDIDSTCAMRLGAHYPRAHFLTGDSRGLLPALLEELRVRGEHPQFVLLDGEHTPQGLASDLGAILERPVMEKLHVLIHDSFNPLCRQALLNANWKSNPAVDYVEIDFVPGVLHERPEIQDQLWGGLCLVILDPHRDPAKPPVLNAACARLHEVTARHAQIQEGQY